MGDVMLHGVLNMPLPDDQNELGLVEWAQFKDRATQASREISALQDKVARLEAALEGMLDHVSDEEFCLCEYKDNTEPADTGDAVDAARIALDTTTATCDNTREGE